MSDSTTKAQVIANRKAWAAALRSGEWKQIRGSDYADDVGYCCLGVMSELFLGNPTPPTAVHEQRPCGLTREDVNRFVRANDELRKSFAEIADMVDALPEPAEVP